MNKFIRYSIFQIFRWQAGVRSRNPYRDAVFLFSIFSMMLSIALFIAVDSIIGLGFIKPGMIVIGITALVYDYFLNKKMKKIGMQSLTDEFLNGDFLMNRKEKLIYEIFVLFCMLSPAISMMLFIDKA